MVRRLHAAGIEVILDVVYNHTAETDEFGPTLSWRGLDNASYYRLPDGDALHYENHTGCGNTLDLSHPRVLQMVMDSLRYWVQEMHVDGFRFDLATVLGRGRRGFDRHAAFFACIAQDPVLAGVKLIAEPWDIGPGGYQLGQFPAGWVEWNDRYRDTMRAFWLGGDCTRGEFARRLCASSDLFQQRGRAPAASLNYVVSHDGFTLRDLVSYDLRHNEANGENNRDGHGHNLSWNCGFEGPTDDPAVLALARSPAARAARHRCCCRRARRCWLPATNSATPKRGNNNPYCQDNPITWIDWSRADDRARRLLRHADRIAPQPAAAGRRLVCRCGRRRRADLAAAQRASRCVTPIGTTMRREPSACASVARGRSTRPLLLLVNAGDRASRLPVAHGSLAGCCWTAARHTARPPGRTSTSRHCNWRRAASCCCSGARTEACVFLVPVACCCTPPRCQGRTAAAIAGRRPTTSSTGWSRRGSRCGRSCR